MYYSYLDTPIGRLLLAGEDEKLKVIGFPSGNKARDAESGWQHRAESFAEVKRQLSEYFDGARQQFDVALAPDATPFQASVLAALIEIPYGETCSYRDIAHSIGKPKAMRAVGGANGSNPIPIIIPCHRVVGADGSLTGFGGGLETKRYLLDLERSHSGLFG